MSRKGSKISGQTDREVGLVPCPVCSKQVPFTAINVHLDSTCSPPKAPSSSTARKRAPHPGHERATASPFAEQQEAATQSAAASQPAAKRSKYFSGKGPCLEQQPALENTTQVQSWTDFAASIPQSAVPPPHLTPTPAAEAESAKHTGSASHPVASVPQRMRPVTEAVAHNKEAATVGVHHCVAPVMYQIHQPTQDNEAATAPGHQSGGCVMRQWAQAEEAASDLGSAPLREPDSNDAQPQASSKSLALRLRAAANQQLPGQFLFERFVSEEEERRLVAFLDSCDPPWQIGTFNGPHRGKAWGVRMNLQKRTVSEPAHPMPPLLLQLAERMRRLRPLQAFFPNEANALDYVRDQGHYLGPHVDDRQLSTGAIVTLSLVSEAVMSFRRDRQPSSAAVRITLQPRSLQVLTQEARYSFTHAIAPEDFCGGRRLSVTFRQSPLRR